MARTRKLTLTATPEVIALAEEQAKNEGTSISAMFANFVMAKEKMSKRHMRTRSKSTIGPLTRSLTGIVRLPDDFDEKEFMSRVFMEKYGLK